MLVQLVTPILDMKKLLVEHGFGERGERGKEGKGSPLNKIMSSYP